MPYGTLFNQQIVCLLVWMRVGILAMLNASVFATQRAIIFSGPVVLGLVIHLRSAVILPVA